MTLRLAGLFLLGCVASFPGYVSALDYFVSPRGDDGSPGNRRSEPFRTLQHALDIAKPGDRIMLAAGEYWEDVRSVRSGKAGAPIQIVGVEGATIKGAGKGRVMELNHSYISLTNLTFDGRVPPGKRVQDYRDKLLYIMGKNRDGVTGIKITDVVFQNAGGECLRLKYFSHHNEIAHSRFNNCGVWDFRFKDGGKNGEAIYIGTAPEQLKRNPSRHPDASNNNWIHHNYFDTRGNECVDIKEGASHNLVEHNECTGQRDKNSAGMDSRGSRNIFRYNLIRDNAGAGIRLGGDTAKDGIYNEVYGNTLQDNKRGGLKIMATPQSALCGNTVRPADKKMVQGKHAKGVDPRQPCSG